MPEGDSLRKLRDYLAPRLEGFTLAAAEGVLAARTLSFPGARVARVDVHGKHLLIALERGSPPAPRVLRIHLGMHGGIHHYRHGESWRRSVEAAQAVLVAPAGVFVAFRCAVCELTVGRDPSLAGDEPGGAAALAPDHPALARLGPDLLARDVNLGEVLERARVFAGDATTVSDLLLDQRVAAGIGNVYKSELLHLGRIWPWTPPERVTDVALTGLYRTARTLLAANVGPGPRVTTGESLGLDPPPGATLWVYGRAGEPCLSCRADVVERARIGVAARVTYFCLTCQPPLVR